ncbi:hypothetical protein AMECASPLE_010394, partial [Ameca splendens]
RTSTSRSADSWRRLLGQRTNTSAHLWWDTEDTLNPSFKSGEKKDEFVGTLEIGQHSSSHPGRYRPTDASFKGCRPEFGHSNSERHPLISPAPRRSGL